MEGLIGAILGGIIAGAASYFASISGARESYSLICDKDLKEKNNIKSKNTLSIVKQLEYTYNILNASFAEVEFRGLIYDNNLYIKIIDSNFNQNEINLIFEWFHKIQHISSGYGYAPGIFNDVKITADMKFKSSILKEGQIKFHFKQYFDEVKKIIEVYKQN